MFVPLWREENVNSSGKGSTSRGVNEDTGGAFAGVGKYDNRGSINAGYDATQAPGGAH
jgi:hypothetical protein